MSDLDENQFSVLGVEQPLDDFANKAGLERPMSDISLETSVTNQRRSEFVEMTGLRPDESAMKIDPKPEKSDQGALNAAKFNAESKNAGDPEEEVEGDVPARQEEAPKTWTQTIVGAIGDVAHMVLPESVMHLPETMRQGAADLAHNVLPENAYHGAGELLRGTFAVNIMEGAREIIFGEGSSSSSSSEDEGDSEDVIKAKEELDLLNPPSPGISLNRDPPDLSHLKITEKEYSMQTERDKHRRHARDPMFRHPSKIVPPQMPIQLASNSGEKWETVGASGHATTSDDRVRGGHLIGAESEPAQLPKTQQGGAELEADNAWRSAM